MRTLTSLAVVACLAAAEASAQTTPSPSEKARPTQNPAIDKVPADQPGAPIRGTTPNNCATLTDETLRQSCLRQNSLNPPGSTATESDRRERSPAANASGR